MDTFKLITAYQAPQGAIDSYYSIDLYVTIAPGLLQLAQVNPGKNQLFSLLEYSYPEADYLPALEEFLGSEDIFNKPYRKEFIAVAHPYSTLVPNDIFQEKKLEDYLNISYELPPGQLFLSDDIKAEGTRNIYCLPAGLVRIIRSRFPSAALCHISTPLLAGAGLYRKLITGNNTLLVNIRSGKMDIVIHQQGKLLYFNSFPFNNKEEFAYYILFVLDQLDLAPGEQEIMLVGETDISSELVQFCKEFVGKVSKGINIFDTMDILVTGNPGPGRYFTLLSLRLCE